MTLASSIWATSLLANHGPQDPCSVTSAWLAGLAAGTISSVRAVHDFWTPFRDYFAEDEKDEALFTYPRFLFLKDPDDQWHHVEVKGLAEKLRWLHY